MDSFRNTSDQYFQGATKPLTKDRANAFLRNVFTNMSIGLLLTGLTAWLVASNEGLRDFFYGNQILFYVVMFAPLALVFYLSARVHKMSLGAATLAYTAYAVLNGITFASIFMVYKLGTIYTTFFVTAGTFITMAVVGYTTKVDLTKLGNILYMALIGLVIAMVVNFFLDNDLIDYVISGVGVLIFTGLTAYDTQKMLKIGQAIDPETDNARKIAIMGALTLYLDFINLFLFLLRFFGSRD
ncbi:MAG: Bax inhibitor-1/YccA family protein [Bacteroidia bacterium]|nr:Bax inhibitor-1/YccA family protein [Bacteroidia bacterium]